MKEEYEKLLHEALKYVEHGYHLLPCRSRYGGKKLNRSTGKWIELNPKQPLIPHGVHGSSNNPEQIKLWWGKIFKGCMIGCDVDKSNRWVVDIDNHKVNGFDKWHKLGISDEGTLKVITPSHGLHLYFKGHGRSSTNENVGIDSRGKGGFTILPHSFIENQDGTKSYYVAMTDMFVEPREVTDEIFAKLGLLRKKKIDRGEVFINNLTLDEELSKVKYILDNIPEEYYDNYQDWINIGLSLRKFSQVGFSLWEDSTNRRYFTKNPNSKRIGNLEVHWNSFVERDDKITIGTLYHIANKEKIIWKKEKK